jgi:hypothetical protein
MTGLWEKINQRLHAIVDRALSAHSLALYDQYVRDVEAYRLQIEDSAARMVSGIEANKRRLARHEEEARSRVHELALAGDEEMARLLHMELDVKRELVATTRAQIANGQADYQQLLAGRQETRERLELMRGERPAVESLLAVIRAGELIESVELTLASLAQLGKESAVGELAGGIQRRLDMAEARWQMAAVDLGIDAASAEAEEARVADQLAERIRRLGLDESE